MTSSLKVKGQGSLAAAEASQLQNVISDSTGPLR